MSGRHSLKISEALSIPGVDSTPVTSGVAPRGNAQSLQEHGDLVLDHATRARVQVSAHEITGSR